MTSFSNTSSASANSRPQRGYFTEEAAFRKFTALKSVMYEGMKIRKYQLQITPDMGDEHKAQVIQKAYHVVKTALQRKGYTALFSMDYDEFSTNISQNPYLTRFDKDIYLHSTPDFLFDPHSPLIDPQSGLITDPVLCNQNHIISRMAIQRLSGAHAGYCFCSEGESGHTLLEANLQENPGLIAEANRLQTVLQTQAETSRQLRTFAQRNENSVIQLQNSRVEDASRIQVLERENRTLRQDVAANSSITSAEVHMAQTREIQELQQENQRLLNEAQIIAGSLQDYRNYADQQIEKERAAALSQMSRIEALMSRLVENNERLTEDNVALRRRNEELVEENRNLNGRLSSLELQTTTLAQQHIQALAEVRAENTQALGRVTTLENQIATQTRQHDEALRQARAENTKALDRVTTLENQIATQTGQHKEALRQAEETAESLRAEIDNQAEQHDEALRQVRAENTEALRLAQEASDKKLNETLKKVTTLEEKIANEAKSSEGLKEILRKLTGFDKLLSRAEKISKEAKAEESKAEEIRGKISDGNTDWENKKLRMRLIIVEQIAVDKTKASSAIISCGSEIKTKTEVQALESDLDKKITEIKTLCKKLEEMNTLFEMADVAFTNAEGKNPAGQNISEEDRKLWEGAKNKIMKALSKDNLSLKEIENLQKTVQDNVNEASKKGSFDFSSFFYSFFESTGTTTSKGSSVLPQAVIGTAGISAGGLAYAAEAGKLTAICIKGGLLAKSAAATQIAAATGMAPATVGGVMVGTAAGVGVVVIGGFAYYYYTSKESK